MPRKKTQRGRPRPTSHGPKGMEAVGKKNTTRGAATAAAGVTGLVSPITEAAGAAVTGAGLAMAGLGAIQKAQAKPGKTATGRKKRKPKKKK